MKKSVLYILVVAMALLPSSGAKAFDWKVQTNDELRSDMLAFAEQFAADAHGTKAGRIVSALVKKQTKAADEYSWIADTYNAVSKLEAEYGPVCSPVNPARPEFESKEAMIRRRTLQLLDYPIHVPEYVKDIPQSVREAFFNFKNSYLQTARLRAVGWLYEPAPEPGSIAVMKVYNMGYIIRTNKRTVLLDLRWDGTEDQADFIASMADVFFLTHPHGDHYSKTMLDALQKNNVPVVLPKDLMPDYDSDAKHIIWGNDKPKSVGGVTFTSLKGNQGEGVPNNVYSLEIDGWRIIDQGDNADDELELELAKQPAADIIIAASWNNIQNLFDAAMAPQDARPLFIPSHENEFGHGVDHRESYHELFERKDRLGNPEYTKYPPYVLMDIGENILIKRQTFTPTKPSRDEDINIGYGTVKSSNNTFAVSQVKVNEREAMIYNSMTDYLKGRVAGLDVTPDGKILIRGVSSINGPNEALIVVDGSIVSDVNVYRPNEVEKVEVLKDASSSIYGSRGANGVVLITLKH